MKTYILTLCLCFSLILQAQDVLLSWNEGPIKQSIVQFIEKTTDPSSSDFVPFEDRIAVFDQDGTLWVELPSLLTYPCKS